MVIDAYGHDPYTAPANVAVAANLYRRDLGPVRGAPKIVAENPRQTRILGNSRYSYKGRDVAMPCRMPSSKSASVSRAWLNSGPTHDEVAFGRGCGTPGDILDQC